MPSLIPPHAVNEASPDSVARDVVCRVRQHLSQSVRFADNRAARGMPRHLALCALVLQREEGGHIVGCVARVASMYAGASTITHRALKKVASEARALLEYGDVEGEPLMAAAQAVPATAADAIDALDELLCKVGAQASYAKRARFLTNHHGGRPAAHASANRILALVRKLQASAEAGDGAAASEIRLIQELLTPPAE
jgi:hypothetical protein